MRHIIMVAYIMYMKQDYDNRILKKDKDNDG